MGGGWCTAGTVGTKGPGFGFGFEVTKIRGLGPSLVVVVGDVEDLYELGPDRLCAFFDGERGDAEVYVVGGVTRGAVCVRRGGVLLLQVGSDAGHGQGDTVARKGAEREEC